MTVVAGKGCAEKKHRTGVLPAHDRGVAVEPEEIFFL
jgi:hypothetical protein